MKAHLLFLMLLTATLPFVSCEGPEGPAGPKGDTGETGDTGPQGPIGSANVIYSDWISYDLVSGTYSFVADVDAPRLTKDILDKGDIRVYIASGPEVFALPLGFSWEFHYMCMIGKIRLISAVEVDTPGGGYKMRYILIPGGVNTRTSRPSDFNDYHAVCQFYGIPE